MFYSAVHLIASADYTPEQRKAWAPADLDPSLWADHMQVLHPFVAETRGVIVGYADLQPSGYIDHFFVAGRYARQGIGQQLMAALYREAERRQVIELSADVSRTARLFFARCGFQVIEEQARRLRNVAIPNTLMRKVLD